MKKTLLPYLSAVAMLGLSPAQAADQVVNLVKDINTQPPPASTEPDSMVVYNNALFIATDDVLNGSELWRSDGTANGTGLFKDLENGVASSRPSSFTQVGSRLYFVTNVGGIRSLWVSNGTSAGTIKLKDNYVNGSGADKMVRLNDNVMLFEGLLNTVSGRELWRTDGTVNGTTLVKDINTNNSGSSGIDSFILYGSRVFFTASDPDNGRELWKTDGTTAGTTLVTNLEPSGDGFINGVPPDFTLFPERVGTTNNFVDTMLFTASVSTTGSELYRADNPNGTTVLTLVRDIATGTESSTPRDYTLLTRTTNTFPPTTTRRLIFSANNITDGRELWITDGTTGGTTLVKNIQAGSAGSGIANLVEVPTGTALGNIIFFTADDGSGTELHRTDGTLGGTQRVRDINPGSEGSSPSNLTAFNNRLIFTAVDETNNLGLYISAGLTADTLLVKDLPETQGASSASHFNLFNGSLYFLLNGNELWVTNGTEAGTLKVTDFRPGTGSSDAKDFTTFGTDAVFSAVDGINGRELWKTDGTEGGTSMIKDAFPGTTGSDPLFMTSFGGRVYYSAQGSTLNRELWSTDGTAEGTDVVKIKTGPLPTDVAEINPTGSSSPEFFTVVNGKLYFAATDGVNGKELWTTDGTPEGLQMLKDLNNATTSSNPESLTEMNNMLYFNADSDVGRELWKSDGTANGTNILLNIGNGGQSGDPQNLTVFQNAAGVKRLYFSATRGGTLANAGGTELWRTDGTTEGTVRVKDIFSGGSSSNPSELTVAGTTLFFVAEDQANGVELWKSDGNEAGTVLVKNIAAGGADSNPRSLTAVGDKLFFLANDGTNGEELWVSNGTAAGTVMVRNIVAGAGSPNIQNMTNIDGALCFTADDGINGRELWVSNGTATDTFIVAAADLTGLATSSNPNELFSFQNQLLFNATDFLTGQELRLANVKAEIVVEQPILTPLVSGTSTVDFGSVNTPGNSLLSITLRNTGLNILRNIKATLSGFHTSEFAIATQPATTLLAEGSTTIVIRFTPKENGPRIATLRIASNDAETPIFSINLLGTGVKDVPRIVSVDGTTITLRVTNVSGTGLTYQWRRNGVDVVDDDKHAGATKATLTIKKTTPAEAGLYTCLVTALDASTTIAGSTNVVIFNARPEIAATQNMDDGIVGGYYQHDILFDPDSTRIPTAFSVKNLPLGLKLDTKTGRITGRPTVAKDNINITVRATNSKGFTEVTDTINIAAFPAFVEGIYTGPITRNAVLNNNLGGRIDLTVTKTGTFTGSLMLGTVSQRITGVLEIDLTGAQNPSVVLTIPRTGRPVPPPLTLAFKIQVTPATATTPAISRLTEATLTDGTNTVLLDGWRQPWNTTTAQATHYLGYYTFGLKLAAPTLNVPQGWGYGSFTVAKDGKLTLAGRTSDGETITGGTFLGPQGQILVFHTRYTPVKGSILGQLLIDRGSLLPENLNTVTDNTLSGDLDWVRPASTLASARLYKAGFGLPGTPVPSPVELDAVGSLYVPIRAPSTALILGLTAGTDNAKLDFSEGGLPSALDPDTIFDVGDKNKITMPPASENPTATKFTVAAATGLFSGSFTLEDNEVRTGTFAGKKLKRLTNYFGLLIKDGATEIGAGYFLLNEMPVSGPPATTPTTSPLMGGKVELKSTVAP